MPKFKEGDRVRFIQDDNWGHKKGSIGIIKQVSCHKATGLNSHWGHCVFFNEFSSGSYEHFLELVPLTLAEQLEAAKAEVARIEAEIAEASKPKVGATYKNKGNDIVAFVQEIHEGLVFYRVRNRYKYDGRWTAASRSVSSFASDYTLDQ